MNESDLASVRDCASPQDVDLAPRTRRPIINRPQLTRTVSGHDLRILHAYKIYRPDIEGGIPAVMSSLAQGFRPRHQPFDPVRTASVVRHVNIAIEGVPVEAVASLGTLFSTPLAPDYIPAFVRARRIGRRRYPSCTASAERLPRSCWVCPMTSP